MCVNDRSVAPKGGSGFWRVLRPLSKDGTAMTVWGRERDFGIMPILESELHPAGC